MKALAAAALMTLLAIPGIALAAEPVTEAPAAGDGVPPAPPNLWALPAPSFGAGFAMMFGLDGVSSGWGDELARAGRPDIIGLAGDIGVRVFIQHEGFELSLSGNLLFDSQDSDAPPSTSGLLGTVFGEISYDAARSAILTIGPTFGVGWVRSSFCAYGDATPLPASSPTFRRVLANPGAEGSCLTADALLLRPGLVVGVALPLTDVPDGNVGFFNMRPSYSFAAEQSAYSAPGHAPFAGPTLPHPGFGVTFEVGVTFGEGERKTGL